jgi:hypothetical protein
MNFHTLFNISSAGTSLIEYFISDRKSVAFSETGTWFEGLLVYINDKSGCRN